MALHADGVGGFKNSGPLRSRMVGLVHTQNVRIKYKKPTWRPVASCFIANETHRSRLLDKRDAEADDCPKWALFDRN